jgi:hypothetical protein
MDLEERGCGLILKDYFGIRLKGLRKTTKRELRIARSAGGDLKPGRSEYEAGAVTTRSRRSVPILQES